MCSACFADRNPAVVVVLAPPSFYWSLTTSRALFGQPVGVPSTDAHNKYPKPNHSTRFDASIASNHTRPKSGKT